MAKDNIANFDARMRFRALRIDEAVNDLVKKVALTMDQTVVLATPVDTGRARSNWIVSTNTPVKKEIDPYAPGDHLGVGERANAQAAIAQGKDVIDRRTRGQTIYITNNVHYIGLLNQGTSSQAPANFVGIAFHAAVDSIRGAKIII